MNQEIINKLKEKNPDYDYPYAHTILDDDIASDTFGRWHAVVWYEDRPYYYANRDLGAVKDWVEVRLNHQPEPYVPQPREFWTTKAGE